MKYKVGDKVKVRSDLKCEEYYGGITFNFEMNKFKGMEITIARVNYGGYYEVLEILKQWKADHEKKPVEMENVIYIVVLDEKRNVVYEEKTNEAIITTTMKEETLKKYCKEHDGKYYAIAERRCVVKE